MTSGHRVRITVDEDRRTRVYVDTNSLPSLTLTIWPENVELDAPEMVRYVSP
jgi:hypothetical protein